MSDDRGGEDDASAPVLVKDGRSWRSATDADVAWIRSATTVGLTVTSAVPPVFEAYATVVIPDVDKRGAHEEALLRLLTQHTSEREWWLGFLDSGVGDLVFPEARRVCLYSNWPYVLVRAGVEQAATWREDALPWHCTLPDLMFPTDNAWFISALWDDDWWCLGGSQDLVDAVLREPALDGREVRPGEDATPPGHVAL